MGGAFLKNIRSGNGERQRLLNFKSLVNVFPSKRIPMRCHAENLAARSIIPYYDK